MKALTIIFLITVLIFVGCTFTSSQFEATVVDIDYHWREPNSPRDITVVVATVRFDGGRIVDFYAHSLLDWKNDHKLEMMPGRKYRVRTSIRGVFGGLYHLDDLKLLDIDKSNENKEVRFQ